MFGDEQIHHLRTVYNSEHPKEPAIPNGSTEEIWKHLKERFHSKCKSGTSECIISHMMNRPRAPDAWIVNPSEWLSSLDIERVQKQYEKLFKNYKFLGCIPIDFDLKSPTGKCLVDALCSINLKDLYRKGKTQIGIVFNTDVHTGPGEHWIGLFCDIRPELEEPRITYFDSYAQKPEKEVQRLMKRWAEQWDATGIHSKPTELTYNKTRHQYDDSECGMYCLYFHYCCLTGISMKQRIPDEVVRGFRGLLFRVSKK
jgi:hypothetical protein